MKFIEQVVDPVRGGFADIRDKFISAGQLTSLKNLPNKPGVYILYSPSQNYIYPWGGSNVFYIGMDGVSLNQRIVETHKKHVLSVLDKTRKGNSIYYPIYEYAASYSAECLYHECENRESWDLEGELLARFATVYGSIPAANKKHDDFWHRFPEVDGV